ncbi:MAG: DUF4293 domain-containing protein [Bacteroidales bacterium]|nr:DUF4293 domain-containing protein [Bacteroidales bacterium]
MIQRIQTLYLSIAAVLMMLMFSNPIAEIVISDNLFLQLGYSKITAVDDPLFAPISVWPIAALLIVIVVLELTAVFLFRKRQLQIRITLFNLILMFGLVGMIYFFTRYTMKELGGSSYVFLWPVICPMIAIILNYLALKSIQKDELLVRSYERIR